LPCLISYKGLESLFPADAARIVSGLKGRIVSISRLFHIFMVFIIWAFGFSALAQADSAPLSPPEPIKISIHDRALDLSRAVRISHVSGKNFEISTAPGPDGIIRNIKMKANDERAEGNWAVFAIANPTDESIDRLIVAPHYRLSRSGILSPDLGAVRIHSITPSEGFALDRQTSQDSDVFHLTINPGAVITFVAELGTPDLPKLYLWAPEAYKDTVNSYTLYHGILLGIAGLLALLMTILFVVKGTSLFPATAAFSWAMLAYICVDFNFLNKLFEIVPAAEPVWRAGTEVALAASLLIFLFSYLHLHRWHHRFSYGAVVWILVLAGLGGLAIFDPVRAAGIARISLGLTVLTGVGLIGYLSFHKYDRAIMLVPTWLLLLCWLVGAYAAVSGRLDNDIIQPALSGGLALIALLIGFTVMQHAFANGLDQGLFSDSERQALAVQGTDHVVWDWDVIRDRVTTKPDLSVYLGSAGRGLGGPMRNWLPAIHIEDRDQFRMALDALLDNGTGRLGETFRLRSGDGQYRWFSLHARPVIGSDGTIIRCVGMISDITPFRRTQERLLQNSIQDSLTGLPNKQLFLDRLQTYCTLAQQDPAIRPTLLVFDFDDFRAINRRYGLSFGDTFLLAIARRLSRHLQPLDSLCRLSADRFALLLTSQNDLQKVATFTIALRKTLVTPMTLSGKEIRPSVSIGMLPWSNTPASAQERLNDAVLAMYNAKNKGGNRIEPFQPALRKTGVEKKSFAEELRAAVEARNLQVLYHPVLDMRDGTIVGFEASLQWRHPMRGTLFLPDFITAAESADLVMPLATLLISHMAADAALINEQFPKKKLFVSTALPSAQLLSPELVGIFQSALVRTAPKEKQLSIEVPETVLMQNPELATALLAQLHKLGIGLVLNNFGSGPTSLDCLTGYPFNMVRLDRSMFDADKPHQQAILNTLIDMTHQLGMMIVADGVENEKNALLLQEAQCDYLQSTTFCEPIAVGQIVALLEKYPRNRQQPQQTALAAE